MDGVDTMSRQGLKIFPQLREKVKQAIIRSGFARQIDLAEDVQMSASTVSNFINGKRIDPLNFFEICQRLDLNIDEVADFCCPNPTSVDPDLESQPESILDQADDSPFPNYIERPPIESICYQTIQQPGSLLRIKALKRMGKTLLIDRIIGEARKNQYHTVDFSLLLADETVLNTLDAYLRWFCRLVTKQLGLENKLDDYWDKDFSKSYNCSNYFEEYLLPQLKHPLVLAIDDVHRIFTHSQIADDFFLMLRAWFDQAQKSDARAKVWQKLRLVLAYSTEEYSRLDINGSPFNVGVAIKLSDFTSEQVKILAAQQGLDWDFDKINQIMDLMEGHSYLIQRAIYYLTMQNLTLDTLLEQAPTNAGIYSDHLRAYLWQLQQDTPLANTMKKIVDTFPNPIEIEPVLVFRLESLGLVSKAAGDSVRLRCNLYAQYFRRYL